ncbi:MAG: hypothetical protein WBO10_11440 [Pyrinomonadaceae bacterium]
MKLVRVSLLLALLLLAGTSLVFAQGDDRITSPGDERLVGEVLEGWKVSAPYLTTPDNKISWIRSPLVRMNKGKYYATGLVYAGNDNRRSMVSLKGAEDSVNLWFESTTGTKRGLKDVEFLPKVDRDRNWNFFLSGSGGGGEKSTIWGRSISFHCGPCEVGTYTSKLEFKDTISNRLMSLEFVVTVKPLPE